MKICMIFVPLFSQDTPMEWTPESEMIFIFQKVKPTWYQPDLSSVYMAACLLHLRNTSFASGQPAWRQTRSGRSHYKAWLAEDSLTGCRAAWCREELQSSGCRVANESSLNKCSPTELLSCLFCIRWKKLKYLFKCPLVNEMLWPEAETRLRRLAFSPRRDRDLPTLCRDRDETEKFEPDRQWRSSSFQYLDI